MTEWISVDDDRKPTPRDMIWVADAESQLVDFGEMNARGFEGYNQVNEVTHWMPIAEPLPPPAEPEPDGDDFDPPDAADEWFWRHQP